MKNATKALRIAGCVICAVIVVLGTFAGFCLALAGGTFGSEGFFASLTEHSFEYETDSEKIAARYADHIIRKIDKDFISDTYTYFGEQYGDISAVLRSCVDNDTVRSLTAEYLKGIRASLTEGASTPTVSYPADKFIPLTERIKPTVMAEEEEIRLEEESRGVSPENSTALSEEEVDEALSGLRNRLAEQIDVYLNSFKSISLVDKKLDLVKYGYENVFSKSAVKTVLGLSAAIPFAIALAAAVGIWFLSLTSDKLKKTYNAIAAIWVGVVLYAVPMLLFSAYDLPGKLLLGNSFFKLLVVALLSGVISRAFILALIPLIVVTAALVALIVLIMINENKKIKVTADGSEDLDDSDEPDDPEDSDEPDDPEDSDETDDPDETDK
ncbi:MAG: hypothetical protein IJV00_00130 [Clostridia bacterium]|nr:hypothetical protein [Clostridia bacterium]